MMRINGDMFSIFPYVDDFIITTSCQGSLFDLK